MKGFSFFSIHTFSTGRSKKVISFCEFSDDEWGAYRPHTGHREHFLSQHQITLITFYSGNHMEVTSVMMFMRRCCPCLIHTHQICQTIIAIKKEWHYWEASNIFCYKGAALLAASYSTPQTKNMGDLTYIWFHVSMLLTISFCLAQFSTSLAFCLIWVHLSSLFIEFFVVFSIITIYFKFWNVNGKYAEIHFDILIIHWYIFILLLSYSIDFIGF